MRSRFFILLLLIAVVGCGYLSSGSWEDDPKNWNRAFRSAKPEDVVVLHSKYQRSPHFTYEFSYYFEVESNKELREQLFSQNILRELSAEEVTTVLAQSFESTPEWFAPGEPSGCRAWVFEDQPNRNFVVFESNVTGNLFLTDYSR